MATMVVLSTIKSFNPDFNFTDERVATRSTVS